MMVTCMDCRSVNMVGALFCSECGGSLLDPEHKATFLLATTDFLNDPVPPPPPKENHRSSAQVNKMMFLIPSSGRQVTFGMPDEIRVGRADPRQEEQPELDLTEDSGAEYGVSRIHATVRSSDQGVVLVDIDSTNGTYLNSYRLSPSLPYPLSDGDEVYFGRLLVHVLFDS